MKWRLGDNNFFMVCLGMIEWIRVVLKMRLLGAIQACHMLIIDSMETKKKSPIEKRPPIRKFYISQ